jgi:hypothetical protein
MEAPVDDPLQTLFWRDEILQIMYWLQGEGLGEAVAAQDLVPFLGADALETGRYLEQLVQDGFSSRVEGDPVRYQLTELGIQEGGRRFAEEFEGLTNQGHAECNDPNCFCKTEGPQACVVHTSHSH